MTDSCPTKPNRTDDPGIGSDVGRPAWLVSVATVEEMELAGEFPIDVLDFKNPREGALAPTSAELWRVAANWASHLTASKRPRLSAALGEASDALRVAGALPAAFEFAKVGPSQCASDLQLESLWSQVREQLPSSVELVAVAYADPDAASCLEPERVFELATQNGFRRVLLDTFTKHGGSSLEILGRRRLQSLAEFAQANRLWCALAGSLTLETVEHLIADGIRFDCIGARGDLCRRGRESRLSRERMQAWSRTLVGV